LLALGIISTLLIVVDLNSRLLDPFRSVISVATTPLYRIAETPYLVTGVVGETLATRDHLQLDNDVLRRRLLELSQVSQQFAALKQENERLRELLGSRRRLSAEVLVAELTGVVPSPNRHQVIIDKGSQAGVSVGQAVIDADGLFGQVVEVGPFGSQVMLLADVAHAVPVEVSRNGVRSIAAGTGELAELELEYVPVTTDIVEGDLLVSSGLGGRFPRGYPVGEVVSVVIDPTKPYAQVAARPLAALDRTRHVLVVFSREPVATVGEEADPDAGEIVEGPADGNGAQAQPDPGDAT
jgi:rod shape-determining protein MreC